MTPFVKLLPCRNAHGISSLLNPLHLFSGFHSSSIHFKTFCKESDAKKCEQVSEELVQTVSVVLDSSTNSMQANSERVDWSLKTIAEKESICKCPIARESFIYVENPLQFNQKKASFSPPFAIYNLSLLHQLEDLKFSFKSNPLPSSITFPLSIFQFSCKFLFSFYREETRNKCEQIHEWEGSSIRKNSNKHCQQFKQKEESCSD